MLLFILLAFVLLGSFGMAAPSSQDLHNIRRDFVTGAVPDANSASAVANLRMYGSWWEASSTAPILRFQSTLIVPIGSKLALNAVEAVWAGLEPAANDGVLQNVVASGDSPGDWFLKPFYCCNPASLLAPATQIYPGDSLTNTYTLNPINGLYYNAWANIPGPYGAAVGKQPFTGGLVFNQAKYNNNNVPAELYTTTLFTVELQQEGEWDFGPVGWRDIILEINTRDTKWCSE